MHNFQYMKIPLKYFTQEIRDEYNIIYITEKSHVYIEIRKSMYSLKEAGILAFNYVIVNLAPHGDYPVKHAAGIWKHADCKTAFVLCVDRFIIK